MIKIKPNTLELIAEFAIRSIIERTNKGLDEDYKPFAPYSSKPFTMPYGAYIQNTTKQQRDKLKASVVTGEDGLPYVLIQGGYKAFKAARFPQDNGIVNLQVRGMRGGMLSSLDVISKGDNYIILGFYKSEHAKLAGYHQVLGAGKGKTKRKFLGLNKRDIEEINELLSDSIEFKILDGQLIFEL